MAASPALADGCQVGPLPHRKGAFVWRWTWIRSSSMRLMIRTLDAPLRDQIAERRVSNSELARARLGVPLRMAYGPSEVESSTSIASSG